MATRKKAALPTVSRSSSKIRSIRVRDYFNSAVKSFSIADCVRSIPAIDGLKVSQRKALYGTFLRGENVGELQVERLASHVAACVVGDTLVTLASGRTKRMDAIVKAFEKGQTNKVVVATVDVQTGIAETAVVSDAFLTKYATQLADLEFAEGGLLTLTPDHKVFTKNCGWIEAQHLTAEHELVGKTFKSITIRDVPPTPVYDITVPGQHNFYANGVLVHNCTDYHHGGGSMASTIVNMACTRIPGANNMNMFAPEGQFGSRLTKEAGAGRYIFSRLTPFFRQIFRKEDDAILEHNYTDGEKIEPKLYLPLLPMVLVNGASGTGTGHSCEIKSYHPNVIRDACVKVLDGKNLKDNTLVPWFRGFNGEVERNAETGQVVTYGVLEIVNSTTIKISELPIGRFVDDYKEVLNKLEEEGIIKDYDDASTENAFSFTVTCPRTTTSMDIMDLYVKFRLITRDTENFTIWQPDGTLSRLNCAEDIVRLFVAWRVGYYEVRRQKLIADTTEDIRYASEVIRFIKYFMSHTKVFRDTTRKDLIQVMLDNNFIDYERLLAMPIWSLTHDRIADMNQKLEDSTTKLTTLESDDATSMYRRELMAFKYSAADEASY